MELLKGDIDRMERQEAVDAELRQTTRRPEAAIGSAIELAGKSDAERRYSRALENYLRRGPERLTAEDAQILAEGRDMGTGGGNALEGTGGGYFVPVGSVNRVEVALKWSGDMFNAATILDTATGNPLPYPI